MFKNKTRLLIVWSIIQDIGAGKGKYYAVNFPLRDGIDDESYQNIFVPVISKVLVNLFAWLCTIWLATFIYFILLYLVSGARILDHGSSPIHFHLSCT